MKNWLQTLILKGMFNSKKFWYMVIGVLTTIFADNFNLNPDEVNNILMSIGALILGQGFADMNKKK
tara:strand:+ start:298 stop:495 length:198 start_codon:yes stop_codon:yes gene_type:complete